MKLYEKIVKRRKELLETIVILSIFIVPVILFCPSIYIHGVDNHLKYFELTFSAIVTIFGTDGPCILKMEDTTEVINLSTFNSNMEFYPFWSGSIGFALVIVSALLLIVALVLEKRQKFKNILLLISAICRIVATVAIFFATYGAFFKFSGWNWNVDIDIFFGWWIEIILLLLIASFEIFIFIVGCLYKKKEKTE